MEVRDEPPRQGMMSGKSNEADLAVVALFQTIVFPVPILAACNPTSLARRACVRCGYEVRMYGRDYI